MRVYLGPYTYAINWGVRLKMLYMDKRGLISWQEPKKFFDKIVYHACDGLQTAFNVVINRPILDKINRKVKVHIHNYDTWGADHTLALIIVPLLKQLKNTKHGSPYVDDKDVPKHLRSTAAQPLTEEQKNNGVTDDLFHQRWEYILDEMIYAFELSTNENFDDQFYSGEVDWKFNEETKILERGPNNTFKVDHKALKKAYARADEGRRLFAKYYNALWD